MTSPLREAHKDLTRGRIIEAAVAVFRQGDAAPFTIAAVAAKAGMTERTVYRHFESREALMRAVWDAVNDIVRTPFMPDTPEKVVAQPREMFPAFDREEALIRAIVNTKEGRELRLSVNAQRQAAFRQAVAAARPDLEEPAFTRLCAAVQLLDSSFAWAVMKDYWGLDGETAGLAASEAIAALLATPTSSPTQPTQKENKETKS